MKFDDAVWGALLAVLGAAVLVHVQGFPRIPGQNVGPALFPGLVAAALVGAGALLIVRGWSARRQAATPGPWWQAPEWLRSRPQLLAFAVLVGVNVFYLLAVERLGFLIVAFVYLLALMWALRVRLGRAALVALVMTLAIHYAFYKLLRVPLPWGVLQGIAW